MRSILVTLVVTALFSLAGIIGDKAQADTVFAASCFGNTAVWNPSCGSPQQAFLGENATITFPGSVPLDGSSFSGPATLSVSIDGLTATQSLPSYLTYNYVQPASFINIPYLLVSGATGSNSFFDVTLAGPPQTNQFIPFRGLNSAYFALAIQGQNYDFFNTSGTYYQSPPGTVRVGTYSQVGELFTASSTPSPSLYLTVNTGQAYNSASGGDTSINGTLTLATSRPLLGNTIPLPIPQTLPNNITTVQQAAQFLGYNNFDWVQMWDIPEPSPFHANTNPITPLAGLSNDPAPSGYTYFNVLPGLSGWNSYPFYWQPNISELYPYSLAANEIAGNTLTFYDAPADSCLPPISVNGVPTGGYDGTSLSSHCAGQPAAMSGSQLSFQTELVGIVDPGSACPLDGGTCFAQDATDNGTPFELSPGAVCPNGEACFETLVGDFGVQVGVFDWSDSFNGTAGGIPTSANLGSVDPDSGAGGVTVISIDGTPVPEPCSLVLMVTGIGIWLLIGCGARLKIIGSPSV